jgi:hypothetical protein
LAGATGTGRAIARIHEYQLVKGAHRQDCQPSNGLGFAWLPRRPGDSIAGIAWFAYGMAADDLLENIRLVADGHGYAVTNAGEVLAELRTLGSQGCTLAIGCAGSKRKMEPQNTQNTQIDAGKDRVNLLAGRIIGCTLAVLYALQTGFLRKCMTTHWCTSCVRLDPVSRNDIPWSFGTMGSWPGNMLLIYSSNTSSSSN